MKNRRSAILLLVCYFVFLIVIGIKGYGSTLTLLLLPISFIYVLARGKGETYGLKISKYIYIYLGYTILISLLYSKSRIYYVTSDLYPQLAFIFIFLSVQMVISFADVEKVLIWFRNIGIIISVIGLLEYATRYPIANSLLSNKITWFANEIGTADFRIFTFFQHPIVYCVFLIIIWIILYYYPIKNAKLNFIYHIILIVNIYATKSRSSWISFILVLLIITIRNREYFVLNKKRIIYILTFIVIAFVLRDYVINIISDINLRIAGSFGSVSEPIIRVSIMKNAIAYWGNDNLLYFMVGKGSNYSHEFLILNPIKTAMGYWTSAVDNQYITTMLDSGIIGLLLILTVFIYSLKIVFDNNAIRIEKVISLALISMYISMFFYECFSFNTFLFMFSFLVCGLDKAKRS